MLALLPNAYLQGECAGINMAGGNQSYDKAIPMNSIGFFGLHLMTAGSCGGEAYLEKNGGNYKKAVCQRKQAGRIHFNRRCGEGGNLHLLDPGADSAFRPRF